MSLVHAQPGARLKAQSSNQDYDVGDARPRITVPRDAEAIAAAADSFKEYEAHYLRRIRGDNSGCRDHPAAGDTLVDSREWVPGHRRRANERGL